MSILHVHRRLVTAVGYWRHLPDRRVAVAAPPFDCHVVGKLSPINDQRRSMDGFKNSSDTCIRSYALTRTSATKRFFLAGIHERVQLVVLIVMPSFSSKPPVLLGVRTRTSARAA